MKKRLFNWPFDNPDFAAWEVETVAGWRAGTTRWSAGTNDYMRIV